MKAGSWGLDEDGYLVRGFVGEEFDDVATIVKNGECVAFSQPSGVTIRRGKTKNDRPAMDEADLCLKKEGIEIVDSTKEESRDEQGV